MAEDERKVDKNKFGTSPIESQDLNLYLVGFWKSRSFGFRGTRPTQG